MATTDETDPPGTPPISAVHGNPDSGVSGVSAQPPPALASSSQASPTPSNASTVVDPTVQALLHQNSQLMQQQFQQQRQLADLMQQAQERDQAHRHELALQLDRLDTRHRGQLEEVARSFEGRLAGSPAPAPTVDLTAEGVFSPPKPNRYKDAFKFDKSVTDADVLSHFLLYQNAVEDLLDYDMKRDAAYEVHQVNLGLKLSVPRDEYMDTLEPQLAGARNRVFAEYASALDLRSALHLSIQKGGFRAIGDTLKVPARIRKISGKLYDILRHTVLNTEMRCSLLLLSVITFAWMALMLGRWTGSLSLRSSWLVRS